MQLRLQVVMVGAIALASLSFGACGLGARCETPKAPPSYANDGIQAIVKTNCLPCHTTGKQKLAVPDGAYYNSISGIRAQADIAAQRVAKGDMPPTTEPPMPAEDKKKFEQWVYCGAAD